LLETKICACNERVDGILDEIKGVRQAQTAVMDLQRVILYAIIVVAFGVIFTLAGVIMGRGVDFGWIVP
jgi:hypothetical protein